MLPVEIAKRLPDELTGEQLEKTVALRNLLALCEDILELEGERVSRKTNTFDISRPMAIQNGHETLFVRVYRNGTVAGSSTYGFKISPTPDDAPNYDDYSDIRFERGTNGSYELVMGGSNSEPVINDLESIKFLQTVVSEKSKALVQQDVHKQQAKEHKRKIIKKQAVKIGAITVASAALFTGATKAVLAIASPDSAVDGAQVITLNQELSPSFVQGWIGDNDSSKFERIKFDARPASSSSSLCKTIENAQIDRNTQVYAITDFHTYTFPQNPDGVNRSLEGEFTVKVESSAVQVCWAPTSNELGPFEKYYTDAPTVGIYIENPTK